MKTKELVARVRTPFLFYLFIGLGPIVAALVAAMSNTPIRSAMEAAVPLLLRYLAYFIGPPLAIAVLFRWLGQRFEVATLLLLGLVSALVAFAGAGQVAAAAVLLAVSMVIGGLLVGKPDSTGQQAVSISTTMLAGLAITVGAIGWLLPLKIHHAPAYVAASLLVLYFGRRRIDSMSRLAASQWGALSRAHPWTLSFAVASAGLASLFLWLPSLNYDDNSGHLMMANQMLKSGYYRMDVSSHVGAVAPWFNNALHAVLALLSGGEARSAVGFLWLLLGCTGAYRLALSLDGGSKGGVLAAALYASHPLTAYFGTTLQVDGASAACLLHLLATVADHFKTDSRCGSPVIFGALFGVLAALKITNLVYVAPIIVAVVYGWIGQRRFRAVLIAAGIAVVVSGSSYAYAQLVTGNPLFPLYNGIFRSPYMQSVNFADTRWHNGVSLLSPWEITYSTSQFMEAYPGAAGIALVALGGGLLLALIERGRVAAIVLGSVVVGVIVFWQVQYLRYIFPVIAVLSTVAVVGLVRRLGSQWAFAAIALIVCTQCALMRTTNWMHNDGAVDHLIATGPKGIRDLERKFLPERLLIRRLDNGAPFCLLLASPEAPYVSIGAGQAVSIAWYDPRMSSAASWANQDQSGGRWQQVLSSTGISHVETRSPLAKPALQNALDALGFRIVDQIGEAVLWRRDGNDPRNCLTGFIGRRDESRRLLDGR